MQMLRICKQGGGRGGEAAFLVCMECCGAIACIVFAFCADVRCRRELVDRLHQAASDNTALQRRVKEGEQAASDFRCDSLFSRSHCSLSKRPFLPFHRRALEDASIIEQSLRSELQRTRITQGGTACCRIIVHALRRSA
jgi:hypothetical protein